MEKRYQMLDIRAPGARHSLYLLNHPYAADPKGPSYDLFWLIQEEHQRRPGMVVKEIVAPYKGIEKHEEDVVMFLKRIARTPVIPVIQPYTDPIPFGAGYAKNGLETRLAQAGYGCNQAFMTSKDRLPRPKSNGNRKICI